MPNRSHCSIETLEPRRLLSGAVDLIDAGLPQDAAESVVVEWTPPSVSLLRGPEILAVPDGNLNMWTDLAWFEGTLPIDQYTVTINWGDGTSSQGRLTQAGEKAFFIGGEHRYDEPGRYRGEVRVETADGASRTHHFEALPYADPITLLHQSAYEIPQDDGTSMLQLRSFFYPDVADTDAIRVTIDWGDGHVTEHSASQLWSGAMASSASHKYAGLGTYQVTFTATAPLRDGSMTSLTTTRTVEVMGNQRPDGADEILLSGGTRLQIESRGQLRPDLVPPIVSPAVRQSTGLPDLNRASDSTASSLFADDRRIDALDGPDEAVV